MCVLTESALDDLDLNDFGMSALERSLDSSSAGVMLGAYDTHAHSHYTYTRIANAHTDAHFTKTTVAVTG